RRGRRIALLKGWHNYLCVHKVGGGYPADEPTLFDLPGGEDHPRTEDTAATGATAGAASRRRDAGVSLADHVRRLHEWAAETDSGDRDDLVPGVPDRAWRQVSVTAMECLGGRCPLLAECFPDKARATAREADVVVTNHAMLGIAATGPRPAEASPARPRPPGGGGKFVVPNPALLGIAPPGTPGVLPDHEVVVVEEANDPTAGVPWRPPWTCRWRRWRTRHAWRGAT